MALGLMSMSTCELLDVTHVLSTFQLSGSILMSIIVLLINVAGPFKPVKAFLLRGGVRRRVNGVGEG